MIDAALTLFAKRGYDATTSEEIASAVGVSQRTFFRYFPTKESVLFFGEYEFVRTFAGVYHSQPAALDEIEAIRRSLVALAPGAARLRRRIAAYQKVVASSAVARGREHANRQEHAATISRAIAGRRGLRLPDAACELLAAITVVLLQRAVDQWVAGPLRAELGAAIAAEFALLREVVCAGSRRLTSGSSLP